MLRMMVMISGAACALLLLATSEGCRRKGTYLKHQTQWPTGTNGLYSCQESTKTSRNMTFHQANDLYRNVPINDSLMR